MENPRTIFIYNRRGVDTTYAVCYGPPEFRVPGGTLDGFMTVWQSFWIPNGGYKPFMTGGLYAHNAWVGATRQHEPVGPGVRPVMGMSLEAQLGTEDVLGTSFNMQIEQNFPILEETAPPRGQPGAFEVWTGHDFVVPNDRYLVGIAEMNQRFQFAPVAFVNPFNNTSIQISPKMRFWIIESPLEIGVIVNYEPESSRAAVVDFTSGAGEGKYIAEVTQSNDGTFSVTY